MIHEPSEHFPSSFRNFSNSLSSFSFRLDIFIISPISEIYMYFLSTWWCPNKRQNGWTVGPNLYGNSNDPGIGLWTVWKLTFNIFESMENWRINKNGQFQGNSWKLWLLIGKWARSSLEAGYFFKEWCEKEIKNSTSTCNIIYLISLLGTKSYVTKKGRNYKLRYKLHNRSFKVLIFWCIY